MEVQLRELDLLRLPPVCNAGAMQTQSETAGGGRTSAESIYAAVMCTC